MARIAVLVSNPCTSDARVIKMAQAASQAGHEVHVFATMGAHAKPFEQIDGVTYHRLEWRPGAMLTKAGPLAWIKHLNLPIARWVVRRINPFLKYSLYRRLFAEMAASINPDLVHAHDLLCLPAGYAAAKQADAGLVYDAHELEVHRNPPLPMLQKLMVDRVEKRYARKADAVITVGKLIAQELGRSIRRDDITVIYNSPILAPCPNHIRGDLCIDDDVPLIIYVGKVTVGRGVRMMLDSLPQLPGAILAVVGPSDPGSKARLEGHASRRGLLSRFRILPPVPSEQVVSYIRGADVGVISSEITALSYRYAMPNKLFEMTFADVPILSNTLDEIELFLEEIGNGKVIDFEQERLVPYTIYRMMQEKVRYKLTKKAQAVLNEKYSWDVQANKLLVLYNQALSQEGKA